MKKLVGLVLTLVFSFFLMFTGWIMCICIFETNEWTIAAFFVPPTAMFAIALANALGYLCEAFGKKLFD